jgi:hypothetical protein
MSKIGSIPKTHLIERLLREKLPGFVVRGRVDDVVDIQDADGKMVGFVAWHRWRGWGDGKPSFHGSHRVGGYMGGGKKAAEQPVPLRYVGRGAPERLVEDFVAWLLREQRKGT